MHIVLHIKYYPFLEEAKNIPVPYARILGFSKKASPLLREIRKKSSIDIIQRPIEGKKLYAASSPQAQIYNVDIRSADFYEQIAARKAGTIAEHVRRVLAMELMVACQGIDMRGNKGLGKGTQAAYDLVRKEVATLDQDRELYGDINYCEEIIKNDALIKAVEEAISGSLETK